MDRGRHDGSKNNMLQTIASLALAATASFAAPKVTMYPSFNQALNVITPGGVSKGGTVAFIGRFDKTASCEAACLASKQRCWSFVHFPKAGSRGLKEMKIRVAATGLQLQADDLADGFISTRYQGDDAFSRFHLEPLTESDKTQPTGSAPGAVRIRVVADGRRVGANAKAGTDAWPAWSVSTKAFGEHEDDSSHFTLHPGTKSGTTVIQTEGGASRGTTRHWVVDTSKNGFVWANASAEAATDFIVSIADGGGGGDNGGCYAGISHPLFSNPAPRTNRPLSSLRALSLDLLFSPG